jgi:hypothetical protein
VRYPSWVGWLHGRTNLAARRWVDAHVRPWCTSSDAAYLADREPYSVEAYLRRYKDEAASWHWLSVTPGRRHWADEREP